MAIVVFMIFSCGLKAPAVGPLDSRLELPGVRRGPVAGDVRIISTVNQCVNYFCAAILFHSATSPTWEIRPICGAT